MATAPSLTEQEKARFLQALREDPVFREEVRRLLLEELRAAMQDLQEAAQNLHGLLDRVVMLVQEGFEALHGAIRESNQQIRENSRHIAALTQRMERVEIQIAALTQRMERVEIQIAALTGEVREQGIRLADVSGVAAEARADKEIGIWLRNRGLEIVREYLPGDLQDHLGVSSVPDGLMLLRNDTVYVFLVYEVTFTVALRDVRRVAEWLEGFRRAEWPAIGLVHFRRALPEEDVEHIVSENGREVIHTVPGMRTLREEATTGGVLLMQHGSSPWRPEGWQPPKGLEEIPQVGVSI